MIFLPQAPAIAVQIASDGAPADHGALSDGSANVFSRPPGGGRSAGRRGVAGEDDFAHRAAQVRFHELADGFLDRPGVSFGRVWHSDGLKVHGRIFAMAVRGRLVVKVPADRAAALLASGDADSFEPRAGRPMLEWVTVGIGSGAPGRDRWRELVDEAYAFVGSLGGPSAGTLSDDA